MPLKVKCPEGHTLTVPAQRAGKKVRCPICMQTFPVRVSPDAAPPPVPVARTSGGNKKANEEIAPPPSKPKSTRRAKTDSPEKRVKPKAEHRKPTGDAEQKPVKKKTRVKQTPLPGRKKSPPATTSAPPPKDVNGDQLEQKPKPVSREKTAQSKGKESAPEEPRGGEDAKKKRAVAKKKVVKKKKVATKKKTPSGDDRAPVKTQAKKKRPAAADAKTSTPTKVEERPPELDKPSTPAPDRWKTDEKPPQEPATPKPSPAARHPEKPPTPPAESKPATPQRKPPGLLPPAEEDQPEVQGVEHDFGRRWTAYYLGIALGVCGVLNTCPAYFDIYAYYDLTNPQPIHRWTYIVFFIGGLQLAYAIYLVQLPDWSTVWVVAILTLFLATGYAMVLGVVALGKPDNNIVQLLGLSTTSPRSATLWCFSMLSALSLLTYFCGREGMQWHRIYAIEGEVAAAKTSDLRH